MPPARLWRRTGASATRAGPRRPDRAGTGQDGGTPDEPAASAGPGHGPAPPAGPPVDHGPQRPPAYVRHVRADHRGLVAGRTVLGWAGPGPRRDRGTAG